MKAEHRMVGPGLTILLGLLFSAYQLELVDAGALGPGSNADWEFCSSSKRCGIGGGDCDQNGDCENGLICGEDNCKTWHPQAHQAADCCMEDPNAPKCPDGWSKYEGNCYIIVHDALDMRKAGDNCEKMNSQLASVHGYGENEFLTKLVNRAFPGYSGNRKNLWLGSTKYGRWDDGTKWNYQNWRYREPEVKASKVAMNMDGDWLTYYFGKKPSICKRRVLKKN